ncbi:MAG: adenylate/guanylate cyclase domain-containing protein [Pseudomonadota bacterium]
MADIDEGERVELAFAAEARRRAPVIFRARTISLFVVCALVAIIAPYPEFLYFIGLISLFILFGWAQYALARRGVAQSLAPYVFLTLDMALMTFTLISPNPFSDPGFPPQFTLRFGSFVYVFLMIAAASISLSPRLIMWGAACGAVFWSCGVWWLVSLPDTVLEEFESREGVSPPEGFTRLADTVLHPNFVDVGVQFQNIIVLLIVSGVLALGARASRRLLLRETAQASRAANLSRYLPMEAVDALADRDAPFGGEAEREAAILFTDIVGFSALAERLGPQASLSLLRETHALVERAVFAHHGAIDKFIGDGVMATFGAYRPSPDAAANAVACTRAILVGVDDLNAGRRATGAPEIALSVGLHYGAVVAGDVGSARRMEFAVIGDAVNIASRLEAMTRELGVAAAISEETMAAAGWPDAYRKLGAYPARGLSNPVMVWTMAAKEPPGSPEPVRDVQPAQGA